MCLALIMGGGGGGDLGVQTDKCSEMKALM